MMSCTTTAILLKSKTKFSKQFFWTFFSFFLQSSKMSKNMHKLHVKLRNSTMYPPWGPIVKKIFFHKRIPPLAEMPSLFQCEIWNILRKRVTDLKNQGHYKSQFCKKLVGVLHFRENGLAITFTWPNEP